MKKRNGLLILFLILAANPSVFALKIKPGLWKTTFLLRPGVGLPVDFVYEKSKSPALLILNGEETIRLTHVEAENDSLFIEFPTFDACLKIKCHSKTHLTGAWFNRAKSDSYHIPFQSRHNSGSRYPKENKQLNVAGKWEVTFDPQGSPEKAVGLFDYSKSSATSNILYGTFLTETGDYRFLEGATLKDSLYLSCFDGSHAFLFRAQLKNDTLMGDFHSGSHYKTNWIAVKNNEYKLRDPDSLTYLISEDPIKFSLPTLQGDIYEYPNPSLKNKVVLIQIMGTWCPNCLDESRYLKTVYDKNSDQLEILAITFETQKSMPDKVEKVQKYKEVLELNYTFLIGGDACKSCAAEIFPQVNTIISFPTLIFIDKTGTIRKIHTGFNGPGTGEHYSQFLSETNQFIEQLIQE